MNAPMQLSIPENAQIHIHFGSAPGLASACFADAATVSPPRHTLRLAVAAVLLFGGGYFARGITAQSAGTDIPRPPVAMRLPLIPGSLPPGALPIFPQTPSSLPALGGATPRSPTAFAPPAGPTGPPAPTASVTPGGRSPFGLD